MHEEISKLFKLLSKYYNWASNFKSTRFIEEKSSKITGSFFKKSLATKLTALAMLGAILGSVASLKIANAIGWHYLGSQAISENDGGSKVDEKLYQILNNLHKNITNEIDGNQSYYDFYVNEPGGERFRVKLFNSNAEHILFGDWEYRYMPHQYQLNTEHHKHWVRPILDLSGTIKGGHTIFSQLLLQDYVKSEVKCNGTPNCPNLKKIEALFLGEGMSNNEIESLRNIVIAAREVLTNQNSQWFIDEHDCNVICCVGESKIANCKVRVVLGEKIPLISGASKYGRKIISVFPEIQ